MSCGFGCVGQPFPRLENAVGGCAAVRRHERRDQAPHGPRRDVRRRRLREEERDRRPERRPNAHPALKGERSGNHRRGEEGVNRGVAPGAAEGRVAQRAAGERRGGAEDHDAAQGGPRDALGRAEPPREEARDEGEGACVCCDKDRRGVRVKQAASFGRVMQLRCSTGTKAGI